MRVLIDLDGVLCEQIHWTASEEEHANAKPLLYNIKLVNTLKDRGVKIIIFSARAKKLYAITKEWLEKHGVKYDDLRLTKPWSDFTVDDRCMSLENLIRVTELNKTMEKK